MVRLKRASSLLLVSPFQGLIELVVVILIINSASTEICTAAASPQYQLEQKLGRLNDYEKVKYRQTFPKRVGEEAAVVEWGHSAIISALDAVVAKFGPQPSMGASFEVEAAPVLADPMDGYTGIADDNDEPSKKKKVLKNAKDVHGNMCVMTNSAGMSGVAMATIAKNSGAVALMVVNVLEVDNPDFIYSMQCESDEECAWAEENIDIPVIMISLSSGNILTTANSSGSTSQPSGAQDAEPQLSMPERVRLYAGGDRPFYEDVQNEQPAVYLIHNLLTEAECDALIRKANNLVDPLDDSQSNTLEGTTSETAASALGVQRAFLWTGIYKTNEEKAIDERIEQITGFPQNHLSDFQLNKFTVGSYHRPHYDASPSTKREGLRGISQQIASIHVFLTDASTTEGGEFVFPLAAKPIKIIPKKGMAVVYHNAYEDGEVDYLSAHGDLPLKSGTKWTARKFVYQHPISKARRMVLPLIAYPLSGKAPNWVKESHKYLIQKFGPEIGNTYFDQMLMAIPAVIFLCIASILGKIISGRAVGETKDTGAASTSTKVKKSSQSKKSKKE